MNEIMVGDLYLAKRNTGWKLLSCKENNGSFVTPNEIGQYCFDVNECYKVNNYNDFCKILERYGASE